MTGRTNQILLLLLMGLAACGLVLSVAVHVLATAGLQVPGGNVLLGGFCAGLAAVIVPLLVIQEKIPAVGSPFSAGPPWMRYAERGFSIYTFAVVAIVAHYSPTGMSHTFGGDAPSRLVWWGFSSVWIATYAAALASLIIAYRGSRCPSGHNT
jgi:hypothetical protein